MALMSACAHAGQDGNEGVRILEGSRGSADQRCAHAWLFAAFEALDRGELLAKRVRVFPDHELVKAVMARPHLRGVRVGRGPQLLLPRDASDHNVVTFERPSQSDSYQLLDWPVRSEVGRELVARGDCPAAN